MRPVRGFGAGLARGCIALIGLCGLVQPAHAQQALSASPLAKRALRIDGDLRDWLGPRFAQVGDAEGGSFDYALGFDAQALYIGVRVRDDDFVRTRHPGPAEDAVVLTLAMPRAGAAPLQSALWLYAGIPGKLAAQAAIATGSARPLPSKAVSVVEGPLTRGGARGYVLEARVPWSAIPGSAERMIARGAIALHDVDGKRGARPTRLSSAGPTLAPLQLGDGGNAAIAAFLREKKLASGVTFDLTGDLAGDARLERVVLAGTYAVVAGPDTQNGKGYGFLDLPVPMASDVLSAELKDVTGDGKAELLVRLREQPDAPRAYSWDGTRFSLLPPPAPPPGATVPAAVAAARAAPEPAPPPVAHPAPPGATELIAAFREARGIDPALEPRFLQHVNVAEDARLESLMLFGKDLLVIGKGYRGGTGYFYFALPVRDAADIERLFTADVTGDGRRELFVRFKQDIGDVRREILLGYTFTNTGMSPILAVEVRREQNGASVGNVVRLLHERGHYALRIAPGRARGWDAGSYPFVAESSDGYGPLLLPWKDRPLRYRFNGEQLVGHGQ